MLVESHNAVLISSLTNVLVGALHTVSRCRGFASEALRYGRLQSSYTGSSAGAVSMKSISGEALRRIILSQRPVWLTLSVKTVLNAGCRSVTCCHAVHILAVSIGSPVGDANS